MPGVSVLDESLMTPGLHAEPHASHGFDRRSRPAHLDMCRALPAGIIGNAQVNLAVPQGVASFFHRTYPLADLQQIVAGIKNLGYTFVSPAGLPG
jgi:hypothetical protein